VADIPYLSAITSVTDGAGQVAVTDVLGFCSICKLNLCSEVTRQHAETPRINCAGSDIPLSYTAVFRIPCQPLGCR